MRGITKITILAVVCSMAIILGYLVLAPEIFPKSQFDSSFRKAIESKRGDILDTQKITQFEWDRLDIYTPYMNYKDENGTKIDVDEGHCHLVFSNKGIVIETLKLGRSHGDFAGLYREGGYNKSSARFRVSPLSKGRRIKLEWAEREGPTSAKTGPKKQPGRSGL